MQGADILGIRAPVDRLLAIQEQNGNSKNQSEDTLLLKSLILRKILRGVLEIRLACNKIDLELAYTYDVMQKEQRREAFIFELFNLATSPSFLPFTHSNHSSASTINLSCLPYSQLPVVLLAQLLPPVLRFMRIWPKQIMWHRQKYWKIW